jgi:hypothetical protein
MSPKSIEDQSETVGDSCCGYQYRQPSNILDLLGLSDCMPRTACRAEKSFLLEEENYGRPLINLALLDSRQDSLRVRISG